ncbi:hypothetical protein Tco_0730969, partial [Tanacetum coccineum]
MVTVTLRSNERLYPVDRVFYHNLIHGKDTQTSTTKLRSNKFIK